MKRMKLIRKIWYLFIVIIWMSHHQYGYASENDNPTFPKEERIALEEFYNSTNGPFWRWWNATTWPYSQHADGFLIHIFNRTAGTIPWNFTDPNVNPCKENWQGVVCDCTPTTCSVVGIDLPAHNISGAIPSSFSNLMQLTGFTLRKNNISQLPDTLPLIPNLRIIDLGSNSLSGEIPYWFGNLTNLNALDLQFNYYTQLPPTFSQLKNLAALSLGFNLFSGSLPSELSQLTSLRELSLTSNNFQGTIPSSFQELTNMKFLDFSFNNFSGPFPTVVLQLSNLTTLGLAFNQFTGTIPEEIGIKLLNLRDFFASSNRLWGSIPSSLGNCTGLTFLGLQENYLSKALPNSFTDLNKMRVFLVYDNSLTGNLVHSFPRSAPLTLLYLQFNFFTGPIHEVFNNSLSIFFFVLSDNLFSQSLPVRRWPIIYEYFLHNNYFTGTIPSQLFQNSSFLRFFYVDINYLNGTIPNDFIDSRYIANINISTNFFSGTLPDHWGKLKGLNQLFVDHNALTGTIPSSYGNLDQLIAMSLANNRFIGTIPAELRRLVVLEEIFLEHNSFSGSVTELLNNTFINKRMMNIDLSDNLFTGSLAPKFFKNENLKTFSSSINCLSGSIPMEICDAKQLNVLSLDGMITSEPCRIYFFPHFKSQMQTFFAKRYFQQSIPTCIFDMRRLESLHLSGNGLMGSLPSNLSISTTLRDLSLSHNLLTGTIPQVIQDRFWYNLDLSYNKFTGSLSNSFYSLPENGSIYLEVNRLSGDIPSNLLNAQSISILNGNIFYCGSGSSNIPRKDPDAHNYNCGSDATNFAIYSWMSATICIFCIFVLIGAYWMSQKHSNGLQMKEIQNTEAQEEKNPVSNNIPSFLLSIQKFSGKLKIWRDKLKLQPKSTNLFLLHIYFTKIRQLFTAIALYSMIILLPIYSALSLTNSSYENKYAWTISALFLTGKIPVVILCIFLGIFIFLLFVMVKYIIYFLEEFRLHQQAKFSIFLRTEKLQFEAFIAYLTLAIVDFLIMGVLDFSYVYVVLNYSSQIIIVAAFGLAVCRIISNNILLWELLPLFRRKLTTCSKSEPNEPSSQSVETLPLPSCSGIALENREGNAVSPIAPVIVEGEQSSKRISARPRPTVGHSDGLSFFQFRSSLKFSSDLLDLPSNYSTADLTFLDRLMLLNNIVIPILAIFFVSSDCFYNMIFAPPSVTSSYTYTSCPRYFLFGNLGVICSETVEDSTYVPPFLYSYQCSSELVRSYVPVYIWMFLFIGIILPFGKLLLKNLYDYLLRQENLTTMETNKNPLNNNDTGSRSRRGKDSHWTMLCHHLFFLVERILPENLKQLIPETERKSQQNKEQQPQQQEQQEQQQKLQPTPSKTLLFQRLRFAVQLNSYFMIIISFGALFPPLALIACFSVISITYYEEHVLGRLLCQSNQFGPEYRWYEEELEKDCEGIGDTLKLNYKVMIVVAAILYAYLTFDTWGDQNGWETALLPAVLLIGFAMFLSMFDNLLNIWQKKQLLHRLRSIEELFNFRLTTRSRWRGSLYDSFGFRRSSQKTQRNFSKSQKMMIDPDLLDAIEIPERNRSSTSSSVVVAAPTTNDEEQVLSSSPDSEPQHLTDHPI